MIVCLAALHPPSEAHPQFNPERFTLVEVPLERDWAPRDESFVLRASRFRANGLDLDTPIAVYARFSPAQIEMEKTLRAEGFLRLNERGEYTLGVKSPALMSYEGELPRWHPRAWNRMLANRLERFAGAYPDEVALAQALVLGRGERLSEEMRESFRRGGTYHLLVFSGMQIAFAAGLLAALLRWLHAPRASDWLLLTFACLAPLFIGPTASVSRASVGIGLYALSRILERPTSLENLWCFAALLRLIIEPRDLTDPSFHLTYAGAGALLFIGRHLGTRKSVALIVAAEIAIAPLTLFHFHQYALGGAIVTFAIAPLIFAMLVLSLAACAFPVCFEWIAALHRVCAALNEFGFAGWFAAPSLLAMLVGAASALLSIAFLRSRARAFALIAAMLIPSGAAIARSVSQSHVERPRVTFFDIGQGDAIALRSGAQTLIVDGGRDRALLPLLADRGVRKVDAIVLTHAHPDHCGAIPELIEQFDVGRVYVNPRKFHGECASRILAACSRASVPIHSLHDRQRIDLGAFRLTTHLAGFTFRRAPENNASVVLHAATETRSFLLTGDIEKEAELDLADRDLRADVLKVAHHGSRSSTSDPFLDAVQPRVAVISCGRRNLFGHPHPSVLETLAKRRIAIRRTDLDGTIDMEVR
ncbi:MAG TPA: DNA internalization-related competence protein ComEC/Rec2 [Thermoanaerobaculia bacterium]|nr:DNA internalization-related competence protein ComEC/Rec2 [Thermoanaerobaculia bacterium]